MVKGIIENTHIISSKIQNLFGLLVIAISLK